MPTIFTAAEDNKIEELKAFLSTYPYLINQQFEDHRSCLGPVEHKLVGAVHTTKKVIGGAGIAFGILGLVSVVATGGATLIPGLLGAGVWTAGSTAVGIAGNDTLAPLAHDRTGWTPLHFAASTAAFDAARFLIWSGADVAVKSREGHTFLELADTLHRLDLRDSYRDFANKCREEIRLYTAHMQVITAVQSALHQSMASRAAEQAEHARQLEICRNELLRFNTLILAQESTITELRSQLATSEAARPREEELLSLRDQLSQAEQKLQTLTEEKAHLQATIDRFSQIVRQHQMVAGQSTVAGLFGRTAVNSATAEHTPSMGYRYK